MATAPRALGHALPRSMLVKACEWVLNRSLPTIPHASRVACATRLKLKPIGYLHQRQVNVRGLHFLALKQLRAKSSAKSISKEAYRPETASSCFRGRLRTARGCAVHATGCLRNLCAMKDNASKASRLASDGLGSARKPPGS